MVDMDIVGMDMVGMDMVDMDMVDMDMVDMDMVDRRNATSPTPGYGGQLDMDIVVSRNGQLQWSIIGSDMPSALGLVVNVVVFFIIIIIIIIIVIVIIIIIIIIINLPAQLAPLCGVQVFSGLKHLLQLVDLKCIVDSIF